MCGRYVLALRPSEVRQQLEQAQMPVDEAPDDDSVRQSYNFAPGYHGLVYRADGPDDRRSGAEEKHSGENHHEADDAGNVAAPATAPADGDVDHTTYKLQAMKWGLVPFWTKRNPDYGSMMKTINCRDDSLYEDRSMWTSMKKKKRCIVVAQGFYEWLKKNNGKEKIPHFTKRKDGQLMCFAGLWDVVQFEGSTEVYTYTIITTDSNKQLSFLHDRMPVILENGSDAIRTWLDPKRTQWSNDLQSLLKPFQGELECYPVNKDVGKVGNNSPSFLVPINSTENKRNIANFFGNQQKATKIIKDKETGGNREDDLIGSITKNGTKTGHSVNEPRGTTDRVEGTEDNAPLPVPATLPSPSGEELKGVKREHSEVDDDGDTAASASQQKRRISTMPAPASSQSPKKSAARSSAKKATRSATSNGSAAKAGAAKGNGSRKITSFFSK